MKQVEEERAREVLILGDVTDAKDRHSAELVNRTVASVRSLAKVARVTILAGNHDWLQRGQEFFRFLNGIDGVRFITEPQEDQDVRGEPTMFLPYSKNPARDWKGLDLSHYRYVFMHQTVKGAVASNGQEMGGEELPDLSAAGKVYSGDIHVPQVIGPVEYVGSPYHVHFGDKFKPRVLVLEKGGKPVDLRFPCISRHTLRYSSLDELLAASLHETAEGDQVKLVMTLDDADKHDWSRIKREATAFLRDHGVEVFGVEMKVRAAADKPALARALRASDRRAPEEDVARFVEREELGGDALQMALEIVDER